MQPKAEVNKAATTSKSSSKFTHRRGRWCITLQHDADAIPLICYLANQHPKSVCSISHTQRVAPYGSLFKQICTNELIVPGKKQTSVETTLKTFSKGSLKSGLCLLRGNTPDLGSYPCAFNSVKADALIYWGLPTQNSYLWPSRVLQGQFTHIYLILPPDQLIAVTNLVPANDFPEHPDSNLLNAQGSGSPLYLVRERVRSVLVNISAKQIKQISRHYTPAHRPAHSLSEFMGNVMLRSNYQ
ncbi:hypothetical protein OPQ81_002593 [Rhizoctonia solani]|nr:hypothetical protein OPQ81_002593 [Rhizoctonia solani]